MIYLASPYTHPDPLVRQWRFEQACAATAKLLRAGVIVFSPVAHSHPIAQYGLPTSWQFWERFDEQFLRMCDRLAVLTLPGWEQSVGVGAEIRLAQKFGLPVVYLTPGEEEALAG